jgi:2-(1,2-epoxy-1,2-dihydrophenyl)acetyl-CoA isomerase
MYETIKLEESNGIFTLTLNEPQKRNALGYKMAEEFDQAIQEVERDPQARFLILTGSGKAFCAGGDFESVIKDLADPAIGSKPLMYLFYKKFLRMRDMHLPSLAAINGHAIGAGLCLALACDMRIASSQAQFAMNFVHLGIHPGMGGTHLLTRAVGTARAFEIFLTGDRFSAQEAFSMGVLNRVVEPDRLMPEAMAIAQKIASFPQLTVQHLKRSIYLGITADLSQMMHYEVYAQALTTATGEFGKAVHAFLEKRPAEK